MRKSFLTKRVRRSKVALTILGGEMSSSGGIGAGGGIGTAQSGLNAVQSAQAISLSGIQGRLRTILDITDALGNALASPTEILHLIVRRASEIFGGSALFSLLAADHRRFELAACHDADPERAAVVRESFEAAPQDGQKGLTAEAMATGEPVIVRTESVDEMRALLRPERGPLVEKLGIRELVIVPAKVQGMKLGTLVVFGGSVRDRLTSADGLFLMQMAKLGGQAVLNTRLFTGFVREAISRNESDVRLRETEDRYRVVFESAPYGIVIADPVTRKFLAANKAFSRMVGVAQDEIPNLGVEDIHPNEKLPEILAKFDMLAAGEVKSVENIPVQPKKGDVFYADITAHVAPYGGKRALAAVFRDITARKEAEASCSENTARFSALTQHLIELQETERRRLAGELHDELGQSLTILCGTLEMCLKQAPETMVELLMEARSTTKWLMSAVRDMSLSLRPAMLDHLGLVAALVWCADRCTRLSGVKVEVQHDEMEGRRFRPEIETAAFRVVQEALTNVVRHAGANSAVVRVWENGSGLFVQVVDQGRGFDLSEARRNKMSLGLACMEERVKMAGGSLSIESEAGAGTYITACFPLGGTAGETDINTAGR
ncbi:MAG: PAS domain S-box protein [Verrucomicrobiia bacterium]